jgi:O-antigen/teichoic acid export membrane protein
LIRLAGRYGRRAWSGGWRPIVSADAAERLVTMGGSRALAAVLGFVATLLIARALEPAPLGLWSMALAVQGLAMHVAEAGLRSVAVTEVARQPTQAAALLRRVVRLRVLISITVIVVTSLAVRLLGLGDWWLATIVLACLLPIALQLDWLPLALGRNREAALLLLARTTAFVALLLVVPLAGDPVQLAWLLLAAWWIAAIASWPCLRLLTRVDAGATTAGLGSGGLLRQALPIAFGTLASQVLLGLDLLLVGTRLGPEAAGFYFLASTVLVAGLVLANGLGQTALARMGATAETSTAFARALRLDLGLVLGVALVAAVTVLSLAPFLLPLAFGAAYAEAARLLPWLLPWFVLTHATIVLQAAMAAGRLGDRLVLANGWMLATLLLSLALAWWLADPRAFAVARGTAELVRLVALWRLLPKPLRPFRNDRRASPEHR